MRLYMAFWGVPIRQAAMAEGIPMALLMATIATENGPAQVQDDRLSYRAVREEPGYESDDATPHRISVGPTHVLISTARTALGDPSLQRQELLRPAVNIRAAAAYMASQRDLTSFDPPKVAAAYNAGGLYEALPGTRYGNPWHLRTFGTHLDRFVAWYGDACAVLFEASEVFSLDSSGLGRVLPNRLPPRRR